ncbi:MAG: hypothetical protein M1514_02405 [Patescibacteria group bacterium]|nr:hypothetical protein [Patescibacteria group bacterium]
MNQPKGKIQVIKIGSNCIIKDRSINYGIVKKIGYEIAELIKEESWQPILIVSGAVGLGMNLLGYQEKPKERIVLQRCAGIGQKELMQLWDFGFKGYALTSQFLLTYHNFSNPQEIENIKNCLLDDVENDIVPLVNYNDKVDWQEVAKDNDEMAADIAVYLKASTFVILTSVDGLLNKGRVIAEIKLSEMEKYKDLCQGAGKYGTGGFLTKLEAAKKATANGTECIIGNVEYKLRDLIRGKVPRTRVSC